jgi:hypothetical protein
MLRLIFTDFYSRSVKSVSNIEDTVSKVTEELRGESNRLGGIPLIAVLGDIGWARVNDALGPVVRDTDGRVFTLSTLASMLEVAPFPSLIGL